MNKLSSENDNNIKAEGNLEIEKIKSQEKGDENLNPESSNKFITSSFYIDLTFNMCSNCSSYYIAYSFN